jgi:hypothetical protein
MVSCSTAALTQGNKHPILTERSWMDPWASMDMIAMKKFCLYCESNPGHLVAANNSTDKNDEIKLTASKQTSFILK